MSKNPPLNRLKAVLAEKGIMGKELATHLNKTETTVSRWCRNDIQPSLETLYDIAKYLKVDIKDLIVSNKKK